MTWHDEDADQRSNENSKEGERKHVKLKSL